MLEISVAIVATRHDRQGPKVTKNVSSRRRLETKRQIDFRGYSMPSFLIRYRSDRKLIPNNCAALVLL